MPAREMLPVIQRCVGRAKASTSITNTAATETITSGAINDLLMMGITDCAKKEFIPVDYLAAASVLDRIYKIFQDEHVNPVFNLVYLVQRPSSYTSRLPDSTKRARESSRHSAANDQETRVGKHP